MQSTRPELYIFLDDLLIHLPAIYHVTIYWKKNVQYLWAVLCMAWNEEILPFDGFGALVAFKIKYSPRFRL